MTASLGNAWLSPRAKHNNTHHTYAARVSKAAETASSTSATMDLPSCESLPLGFNGFAKATFDPLDNNDYMTKPRVLKLLQEVCIVYACLAVKRNDGVVGEKAKHNDAARGYQDIVVPGFLKWARENGIKLPVWLAMDMFGRSTMFGGEGEVISVQIY